MIAALPDPVITSLAAGSVAALGFVGNLLVQRWLAWRAERQRRLARLFELRSLLRATQAAFFVQRQLADRLASDLEVSQPELIGNGYGLDRLFAVAFQRLLPEESDLHSVIRGYTEHALRPLNDQLLAWLASDYHHRTFIGKSQAEIQLAQMLNDLEAHLFLWRAKFLVWIPDRPQHALVYLADEEEHGLRFPKGIEGVLDQVLSRQSRFQPSMV